jgi:NADP-dependent 3-hydroxy acid dehydrogenase YdfG
VTSRTLTLHRVVNEAVERFGRIDTLINNAGIYIGKPFTDYTPRTSTT